MAPRGRRNAVPRPTHGPGQPHISNRLTGGIVATDVRVMVAAANRTKGMTSLDSLVPLLSGAALGQRRQEDVMSINHTRLSVGVPFVAGHGQRAVSTGRAES